MNNFYFMECIFLKFLNFIFELCLFFYSPVHLFIQKYNERLYVLGTWDTVVSKTSHGSFPYEAWYLVAR